jgi:hypothetical protein
MRTAKVVRKDPGLDAIFWRGFLNLEVTVIIDWVTKRHGNAVWQTFAGHDGQIKITNDNGQVYLLPGHWLVECSSGEFEVCSEKQFVKRYDIIGESW